MNAQEHFGRYTLVEKIAVGGMGELYLAQQAGASGDLEKVVVKRIRPELVHDPQFVEMFLNEGRLASMFRHPNIVEIYELGRVDDTYFMAMEYVPGQNLGDILDRLGGPLDVGLALHIIVEVCAGLSAAHEARDDEGRAMRLVHRDISPPNVLISFDGGVKLTDFGIAKVARQQQQTRAGVLKGKFAYLSPEQSLGEPIDRRSDIYALGLVLFEATVGCRANPGAAEVEQIYASSQGRVLKPSLEDPRYPPDLERIFFKATALAPRDRYENAREMQRDLEDFMELRGTSVSRADVGAFLCETFPEKARAAGVVFHEPEAPPSVNFPTSPTDMRF
ncbi:MAG: serine/threonine protein kinase, partial [Deltaproteobacteria bacterium]|nr:serine/threonine protein kinase [Deltaproteobacteria bacterium]